MSINKIPKLPNLESHYTIDGKSLGSGGSAVVYRCLRICDNESFAVKILNDQNPNKTTRFRNEIDVMQKISKNGIDGILPIIEADKDELWYVMPIAADIKKIIVKIIDSKKTDSCPTAYQDYILTFFTNGIIQVAETLQQIHKLGYVHRDIKPDNLYFWNKHFCIGDFGIVDIPDGGVKGLTQKHDRLGAWNTIAPEVLKDARNATPKSDVYSLAKALWMCLSLNCDGFDGRYDYDAKSMSLHDFPHLENAYLLDIDELLSDATQEDPNLRPSMQEFANRLKEWKNSNSNIGIRNSKEWKFVYKSLFNNMHPQQFAITDRTEIARALNLLGRYTQLNYTMMPRMGGDTLCGAETAKEEGCICIDFGYKIICKPKQLVFRGFRNESWNYFYLELYSLPSILKDIDEEDLIEDVPGNYVDAKYCAYGVYDYETGKTFPDGWRRVCRVRNGAFLVVSKMGIYNQLISTDDGRHSDVDESVFFEYICKMMSDVEYAYANGGNINSILKKYSNNPFKQNTEEPSAIASIENFDYISTHLDTICFGDLLDDTGEGYAKYSFSFSTMLEHDIFDFLKDYYLCIDGYVRKLSRTDSQIFYAYDKHKALTILSQIEQRMEDICEQQGIPKYGLDAFVKVHVSLVKPPEHIFTYKELNYVILNADDRVNNTICIDETGNVVTATEIDYHIYPVSLPMFCALENHVGPYSTGTARYFIKELLSLWLQYLKTGYEARYAEDTDPRDIKDIKDEIKDFIDKSTHTFHTSQ